MRTLVREILSRAGYQVLEASCAAEALALARDQRAEIDLVITDVVMPGMNGRDLAEAVIVARPELRIIFMSGYTDDILAEYGVLEPGTFFLEKPFTATALLQLRARGLARGRRQGREPMSESTRPR